MQRDDIPTYSSIMHANANPSLSHHEQEHVIKCPRYWTKGGTLRNIPVGGGTHKTSKRASNTSKRASSSSNSDLLTVNSPPTAKPKLEGFGIPVLTTSTGIPDTSLMGPTSGVGQFAKLLLHGLSYENVVNASDEDGLIRNPIVEDFESSFFNMSHKSTNDQSENGVEGDHLLPDFSIYTPGSSFQ
ncbi:DOF zinc finger protein DOF3.1-like protein [Tanacetum coccineum]